VRHATSHAFVTTLAWPIVFLTLVNGPTLEDDPFYVLVFAGIIIMFIIWCWAIHKVELSLNSEGTSMFYPWRVPGKRKTARRIDGVMAMSIRRLAAGEDEDEVLATLRLHVGGELRGTARQWYDMAVDSLEEASGRDWVFEAERRQRALEEAEGCLWAARAEYLREMIT
jgi:hypothetical protein